VERARLTLSCIQGGVKRFALKDVTMVSIKPAHAL
jgi:hypothetical protein